MSHSLAVKLTVLCSGVDAAGKPFEERTRTTAIEKSGGRLLSQQKLRPGSQLQLCLLARPDRPAGVVLGETVHTGGEGSEWSFQFAGPMADFWGVRFPDEPAAPVNNSGPSAGAEIIGAGTALAQMTEQLVLLAAHADDHLRYCTQEMEVLRQGFTRELQSALDSGTRQLKQLARSTMETTFRSLLEDLARRAAATVDDNLNRLRNGADEIAAQHARNLDQESEEHVAEFRERLDKHARQLTTHLEQIRVESERAILEATHQALAEFQSGCANLLREMLHSAESHKAARSAVRRK